MDPVFYLFEKGLWPLALFAIGFVALWWDTSALGEDKVTRAEYARFFQRGGTQSYYRRVIKRVLDRLDARLSSHESQLPEGHRARSFSFGLLNLCMALALIYPIAMLMVNWVVWNDGQLGGLTVIPEADLRERIWAGGSLSLALGLILVSVLDQPLRLLFWTVAAVAVSMAAMFFVDLPGAFTVAVAFAFAFAGAFIVAGERSGYRTTSLICFAILGLAGICISVNLVPEWQVSAKIHDAGMVLFVGVLPLLNGLADFTSFGATRYFLRKGLTRAILPQALKDIGCAVLIFMVLGCLLILIIHFVRPASGEPMIDLPQVLLDVQNPQTRGEYWFLGFMLFSVVVPTLLHAALALFVWLSSFGGQSIAAGFWLGCRCR